MVVVSLRGLGIRHVEMYRLGAGWGICWSIYDYDYETFAKGVVTYVGMCRIAKGTWSEDAKDRAALTAVRAVGKSECGVASKYYFKHMKYDRSRWDELGTEDWMDSGVAMFDFGKERWGCRHVEVDGQVECSPVWYNMGWRPAHMYHERSRPYVGDWRYRPGGVFTENNCRRLGGTENSLSDGHFGLCVECRKRMVDNVYRNSRYHWNSETERRRSKKAGGVIGGGLRILVMEQSDDHWLEIRGVDVGGEWETAADESFPCHGGKHWMCIKTETFIWQHVCVPHVQGVWTHTSISSGVWGGDAFRYPCPSPTS